MAEGARLESVYMATYRGFESLPLCFFLHQNFVMRIYLSILAFMISSSISAQEAIVDFDSVDSLYREDQFYFNFTYNNLRNTPTDFRQNKFSSGVGAGFLRDMPLNKNRTFSIAAGLGYSLAIYNQNLVISTTGETTTYEIIADDVYYTKDKQSLHFIDLPIEIRWRTSTPDSHKFWRIYSGFKMSYLVYDQYKFVSATKTVKNSGNSDLNKVHYGAYLTLGWNTWNIYAYYGLNPIYKSSAKINNQSIDMSTINFGLMFYIL